MDVNMFTCLKLLVEQSDFMKSNKRIVGYGGCRGGGKYYAVKVKALLMCIKYPGISICVISNDPDELQRDFAEPMKCVFGNLAEYDDRKGIIDCKNGSRLYFRACQKDKTHCIDGSEFDVIFTINAEKYSTTDLLEFSYKIRGSENYPKRIYYVFSSFNEHLERIFLKKEYKKYEAHEDYSYVSSEVSGEITDEILLNVLEIYGT